MDKRSESLSSVLKIIKTKKWATIKEISLLLGISYSVAKNRLHKLVNNVLIERSKSGLYCKKGLTPKIKCANGNNFVFRGMIYSTGNKPGRRLALIVYSSAFAKASKGSYAIVKRDKEGFILRKVDSKIGNKVYLSKSGPIFIIIKHVLLKDNEKETVFLKRKSIKINVKVYLNEWKLTLKQIFSQETKQDGELYSSLSKKFNVFKPQKGQFVKSDLMLTKDNLEVPIEITTVKSKRKNRSSIQGCEIGDRMYHGLKWFNLMNSPYFLVIDNSWKDSKWLTKDVEWLKNKKVYVLYTSFKNNWANSIAKEIETKIST
ncbi:MAG: hypothetical protein PHC66_04380 [Candidatus Nanoarchaeia archaeon]|nr:hypothetical protein [Candidatus Nanoarchaeia archaeon]MDD5239455.1 hypothetical protein [Candidatus Nanoarchaeia archaeon]